MDAMFQSRARQCVQAARRQGEIDGPAPFGCRSSGIGTAFEQLNAVTALGEQDGDERPCEAGADYGEIAFARHSAALSACTKSHASV